MASLKPAICSSLMDGIDVNLHHVAPNMSYREEGLFALPWIQAFYLNAKGEMALGFKQNA